MGKDLKAYIESKLLYTKEDKAYFEISIDGRACNDLLVIDLNELKKN